MWPPYPRGKTISVRKNARGKNQIKMASQY
jgi:hypothetical protein